jgi:hypothetical protein
MREPHRPLNQIIIKVYMDWPFPPTLCDIEKGPERLSQLSFGND